MKKIQNFSVLNLLFSLVVFIIGIVLITNSSFIINILSWIIGGIFCIIGIIKIVSFLRRKNIDSDSGNLVLGIISIFLGIVLVIFPNIIDVTVRLVFGGWILFTGINRLIFAFTVSRIDRVGFKTFLITSIIMMISGFIILISFYELLGLLLVIYSISEIVNYIYFNSNKQKYKDIFDFEEKEEPDKKRKKIKQEIKEKEAIDAVIDE